MKAIDTKLDLGNGLTVGNYEKLVDDFQNNLETYNQQVAALNALRSQLRAEERALSRYSAKMLMGVACAFGQDSYEYQKAGGVRLSDRKRPSRRVQAEGATAQAGGDGVT